MQVILFAQPSIRPANIFELSGDRDGGWIWLFIRAGLPPTFAAAVGRPKFLSQAPLKPGDTLPNGARHLAMRIVAKYLAESKQLSA
jgi:hypothetical protein